MKAVVIGHAAGDHEDQRSAGHDHSPRQAGEPGLFDRSSWSLGHTSRAVAHADIVGSLGVTCPIVLSSQFSVATS